MDRRFAILFLWVLFIGVIKTEGIKNDTSHDGEKNIDTEKKSNDANISSKVDDKRNEKLDNVSQTDDRKKLEDTHYDNKSSYRQNRDYESRRDRPYRPPPAYDRGGYYNDRRDERPGGSYARRDDRYERRYDRAPSSYDRRTGPRPSYDRQDDWPPYERRDDRRPLDDRRDYRPDDRRDDRRDYRPDDRRDDRWDERRDYRRDDRRDDWRDNRRDDRRDDRRQNYRQDDDRLVNERNEKQRGQNDTHHEKTNGTNVRETEKTEEMKQKENNTKQESEREGVSDKRGNQTDDGSTDKPAGKPADGHDGGVNGTRAGDEPTSQPNRRDEKPERGDDRQERRDDRVDQREYRSDRRDDRFRSHLDRFDRRDYRSDRRDDRFERRNDRFDRRDDRFDRRDDRFERRDDRFDRRSSFRSDRQDQQTDVSARGNRGSYRERFDREQPGRGTSDEKPDADMSNVKGGQRDESKPADSRERQPYSRYSDRRSDDQWSDRRTESRRGRLERGETRKPWVAKGSVNRRDLYVDALREANSVLLGQENYVHLLRDPVKQIYGSPPTNQTNSTWTVEEPLKLLDATQKFITHKYGELLKKSMTDMTFDQMTEPLDKDFFAALSDHWMKLKNYFLDHNPGIDLKRDYASIIEQAGKANENMVMEYKIVRNIMKKFESLMKSN